MVLPALNVRVPNPANALLQAEQIKGAREQAADRATARQSRNALLEAAQGANLSTPGGQQQIVNALVGSNPLAALQAQLQINQANAPAPGFTLSPGQERRDAQGNVIASRPDTPSGFTLPPGGVRFDAQGNQIANAPPTPPRPTQRELDIRGLTERGFSQQQAEDIAAGRVRVATDPVTGNSRLVNVATAETANLGSGAPESPVLTAEERGRLFNQNASIDRVLGLSEGLEESAAAASGPGGQLRTLINTLSGIAGSEAPIPAPQTAAARQEIRLFNQIAKAALVNNPKFPVAEQQIVERLLPDPDAFFANPSVEFNKVLQLQQFLRDFRAQNESSLGLGGPQPAAPQFGGSDLPQPQSQADFDALPSGAEFVDPGDGQVYRKP